MKELHERELLQMTKRFEESAKERVQSLKDLQECLSKRDSENAEWVKKAQILKRFVDDRERMIHKLKANAISCSSK